MEGVRSTVLKAEYRRGITLPDLVTVAFMSLKLSGHIDWSWWWVMSPELISMGLAVLVALAEAIKEDHA